MKQIHEKRRINTSKASCQTHDNAHIIVRSSEFGVRSSEFGVRSSEFGVRSSEFGGVSSSLINCSTLYKSRHQNYIKLYCDQEAETALFAASAICILN
ncbi:MAG: hypothetical protein IJ667_00960 [Synergistaceae bacterium]|nr:hypothetical protein [Synergistaceae bacterium]